MCKMCKIHLATWLEANQAVSLTKQNAKHRLMSYYFLRTLKNDPQYVKRYVETGIGDKK